jgi:HSP90 family molecular chaperone
MGRVAVKKLALLLLPLLTSCAAVDAYFMPPFDSSEYKIITEIALDASRYHNQCATPMAEVNATNITYKTELFARYSSALSNNDEMIRASKALNDIAQGLAKRYTEPTPVPTLFCELKYSSIENSANLLQHTLGGRPR